MAPAGTVTTVASAVEHLLEVAPASSGCVVVGGTRGADATEIEAALDAARSGGRVVLALDADVNPALLDTFDLPMELRLAEEYSAPSIADPLLADTTIDATTSAGRPLRLDRVRAITGAPDPSVLARSATGTAVAVELPLGAGWLIVTGTSSWCDERWLTAATNAETLADWLGVADPVAAADRLARSASDVPSPTPVPVVVATDGWLDADLARAATPDTLVPIAGRLNRHLPEAVHDALIDFADHSHPSGALLLRGLPIGDLPPTPPSPTSPTTKDLVSELTLLTVARRLGQPVGYLPELGGSLWQNILPVRASLDRQVSTSSNVELMFHTEAAFHPHRPRFLLLLCLRGDPAARTTLASITDLLAALPLAVRRTLFEPRFRTAADESYVGTRPTQLGAPMAVLSGDWDHPSLVFDADLMVGTDREADHALRFLADLVAEHHHGVVLEPGDLLVVDNNVAVHGRSPFRARFDGTDRWLQRAFVVGDLAPSAGQRLDRVITTRFAG